MKSFVALSALAAIAAAAPHAKRDIAWVTHTDVVTEVVDVTKTVWLGADETTASAPSSYENAAPAQQQQNGNGNPHRHHNHHSAKTTVSTVVVSSPTPSSSSSSSPTYAPTVAFTPVTTPVTTQQATTPSATPYVAPTTYVAPTPSTEAAPYSAPPSSASSAAAAPSSSAPAAYSPPASSGGSGSCADQSGTCTDAKFTYYTTGMGSCGQESNDSEYVFAYGSGLMQAAGGGNSNENPLCGKKISIKAYDGTDITATLVDSCAACNADPNFLDLSPSLWNRVAKGMPGADGVLHNMEFTWQ